jgi:glucose-6-phosphate 1-dehydrogenase
VTLPEYKLRVTATDPTSIPNPTPDTSSPQLQVDNWRWPYLSISAPAKASPNAPPKSSSSSAALPSAFPQHHCQNIETNRMVIHIRSEEGISLSFGASSRLRHMRLGLVNMDFDYGPISAPTQHRLPTTPPYCMAGDATLFQRADERSKRAWRHPARS